MLWNGILVGHILSISSVLFDLSDSNAIYDHRGQFEPQSPRTQTGDPRPRRDRHRIHLGPESDLPRLGSVERGPRPPPEADGFLRSAQGLSRRRPTAHPRGQPPVRRTRPTRLSGLSVSRADAEPGYPRQLRSVPARSRFAWPSPPSARPLPGTRRNSSKFHRQPCRSGSTRPPLSPPTVSASKRPIGCKSTSSTRTANGLLAYASTFNGTPSQTYSMMADADVQFPTITLSDGSEVVASHANLSLGLHSFREPERSGGSLQGPLHGLRRLAQYLCRDLQRGPAERLVHGPVAPL